MNDPGQTDRLVVENMRLAYSRACRMANSQLGQGLEIEDIESEALFGLFAAARKFNPCLGFAFSTYAVRCIDNRLVRWCQVEHRRRFGLPLAARVNLDSLPAAAPVDDSDVLSLLPPGVLTSRQTKLFRMRMEQHSLRGFPGVFGVSKRRIVYELKVIRKILRSYFASITHRDALN